MRDFNQAFNFAPKQTKPYIVVLVKNRWSFTLTYFKHKAYIDGKLKSV